MKHAATSVKAKISPPQQIFKQQYCTSKIETSSKITLNSLMYQYNTGITTLSGGFLVTNWLAREQQMLSDVSYSFFLPILFKTYVISFGGRH